MDPEKLKPTQYGNTFAIHQFSISPKEKRKKGGVEWMWIHLYWAFGADTA
jgi:hypothetical protein